MRSSGHASGRIAQRLGTHGSSVGLTVGGLRELMVFLPVEVLFDLDEEFLHRHLPVPFNLRLANVEIARRGL